jgi:hypothetical protein
MQPQRLCLKFPLNVRNAKVAGQLLLTWSAGVLKSANSMTGPWTAVPGATTPCFAAPATASQQYYRAKQ